MFRGKIILLFVVYGIELCTSQAPDAGAGAGADGPVYALSFDAPIYTCADGQSDGRINTTGLEIHSHNETTSTIGGLMAFLEALPPKGFRIEVIAKKEVSGKFEVVVTKEICDLCDELTGDSDYWKYIRYFGLPPECPFPPGEYFVNGFAPHKDDLPVNSANAAIYQVEIYIFSNIDGDCNNYANKIFLFCLKLDFTIDVV